MLAKSQAGNSAEHVGQERDKLAQRPAAVRIDYRLSLKLSTQGHLLAEAMLSGDYTKIFEGDSSLSEILDLVNSKLAVYDKIIGLITRDNIDVRIIVDEGRIGIAGIYPNGRTIIGSEALDLLSNVTGKAILLAKIGKHGL